MIGPRTGLAVLLVATGAGAAEAQNSLNRPGSGARAAAMGNAFIAVSDDGTAASWNPAGLSQLRRPEFSLVHSTTWRNQRLDGFRTSDQTAAFTSIATPSGSANLEFASAALPFDLGGRPATIQFGWRRLYQFNNRILGDVRRVPIAAGGREEARLRFDNTTSGSIHLWTATAAIRLTNRLSVGIGADIYGGGWKNQGNLSEDPGIDGPTDFLATRVDNRISGHAVNVGLLLAYPTIRVGAVYHGQLSGRYEVTQAIRSNLVEAVDETIGEDGSVHLRLPRSLGVGLAWLPKPLLRFATDLTYDEWTQFLLEGTPDSSTEPVSGFDGLPESLSATRNTVTLNAGMERLFPAGANYLPLRLGFSYEPQGGRDPVLRANSDHFIVAGGTGVNSNSLKIDVSLEYRWGEFRSMDDISVVYAAGRAADFGLPPGREAAGSTLIKEWRLKASVIYRLASADKLWSLFTKPFD
ncbi:MAG: OmpP1/FadL family transporter [Gemmatimonadales bacterium]